MIKNSSVVWDTLCLCSSLSPLLYLRSKRAREWRCGDSRQGGTCHGGLAVSRHTEHLCSSAPPIDILEGGANGLFPRPLYPFRVATASVGPGAGGPSITANCHGALPPAANASLADPTLKHNPLSSLALWHELLPLKLPLVPVCAISLPSIEL